MEIVFGNIWRRLSWWFIYKGPRRDITVDAFNGRLSFDSRDWLIGKYLYVKGSYEAREIQSAVAVLRREGYLEDAGRGTVLDVGANIGMICIALLKHGYFQRAIAFEPYPNSFRLLVNNVNQNGLRERVLHFPWALSCAEGELELELSDDNSGDHRIRRTDGPGTFREERRRTLKVPVKTLDHVFASEPILGNEKVSLLWLDIQGHEGHFFLGASHVLSSGIPAVMELWPYAILRSGMSRSEFCCILSKLFTHFYLLAGEPSERRAISKIDSLFDVYSAPREMCLVALVREQ